MTLRPDELAQCDQRAAQADHILDVMCRKPDAVAKYSGATGLIGLASRIDWYFQFMAFQLGDPHLTACEVLAAAIRRLCADMPTPAPAPCRPLVPAADLDDYEYQLRNAVC